MSVKYFLNILWVKEKDISIFTDKIGINTGALVTAGILIGGIVTFSRGGSKHTQQKFMRARVVAQGATLCAIAWGAYETAKQGPPQFDETKYRGNSQNGK